MATLGPPYAPGLYAGNSLGDAFLSSTVTPATFRGSPLVGVFRGAGTFAGGYYDVWLTSLTAFVVPFNGPLVVLDDDFDSTSVTYLRRCFTALSPLQVENRSSQPVVGTNGASIPTVYAGPFMALGDAMTITGCAAYAWNLAKTYSRTTQNQPWGVGMQAVADCTEYDLYAPCYFYRPDGVPTFSTTYWQRLTQVWQGNAVITAAQIAAVKALGLINPVLPARINPSLYEFLVTV